MNYLLQNTSIFSLLNKWKKLIVGTIIVSATISAIFSGSYFIKPKYKSTAIVYPASLNPYSQETPTEQLLQLFESEDIRSGITKSFNLVKHYNIDSSDLYYRTKLYKIYEENINISKTEFESVQIQTLDTDPIIASQIVDSLIKLVNLKAQEVHRTISKQKVTIIEERYHEKKNQVDSLKTLLDSIRKTYEIIDYGIQLKEASRQYFNLAQKSTPSESNYLTRFMNNMEQKGSELYLITESYSSSVYELNKIQIELENAISDYKKELSYTTVITKPFPADKKSYPIRWLIVLFSMISSFLLIVTIIALIEKTREINVK